jgi:hypothetical protein
MEILAYILEQRAFLQKPSGLEGNVAFCFFLIQGMGSYVDFSRQIFNGIMLAAFRAPFWGDIFWGS